LPTAKFVLKFHDVLSIEEFGSVGISLHKGKNSCENNMNLFEFYDDDGVVLRICFEKCEVLEK
jgi:hypothetical protein